MKYIMILIAMVVMAGCASPAKRACLQTDWQRVGYEEGSKGQPSEHSASRRDTCLREGVPPDISQYRQGRHQGLSTYCTTENGRALGLSGEPFQAVCPKEMLVPFKDGYQKGLLSYVQQLEAKIDENADLLKKMRQQLAGVEEDIAYLEDEISETGTGQARLRMGMISEMNMLERDQQSLVLQIGALEMDMKEMRQQLSRIRSQDGSSKQ